MQFSPCQQATHPPHVIVTIALDPVADPIQENHLIAVLLERFQNRLQLEVSTHRIRPEKIRQRPVRCEHDHEPFLASTLGSIRRKPQLPKCCKVIDQILK